MSILDPIDFCCFTHRGRPLIRFLCDTEPLSTAPLPPRNTIATLDDFPYFGQYDFRVATVTRVVLGHVNPLGARVHSYTHYTHATISMHCPVEYGIIHN